MRIISYSENDKQNEHILSFIQSFDRNANHLSFQGKEGFNMFIKSLQKEDTVIFFSLYGVFRQIDSFMMFIRFCISQKIRIISIDDEIDSEDEIFLLSCASRMFSILCRLKSNKDEGTANDAEADVYAETYRERMLKRHRMVINLYNANYSIKEILRLTGYKSNKNIYLILKRYGIDVENPNMRRSQTKDSHPHTD